MKRKLAGTLFAAALVVACPQWTHAQNDQSANANWNGDSAEARQQASEMVPAQAALLNTVDAKKCRKGEDVRAELRKTVKLKNGPELPRGTKLVGKVTEDQAQANNVKVALRFDQAKLKNGSTVPIKAMIVNIAPPVVNGVPQDNIPAGEIWNPHTYRVDQIGAVSGADLHSSITSDNSAVISSSKKSNVRIGAGSRIDLAIGEQAGGRESGDRSNPTF